MALHVLVADQQTDNLMLLAEFLLRRECSVETCVDGKQATDAVIRRIEEHTPYDLVIASHDLPSVDGLHLLYDARRRHLKTHAAIICPLSERNEKIEKMARKIGCSAFLGRPFDLMAVDRLVKAVDASVHKDAQASEPPPKPQPEPPPRQTSRVTITPIRQPSIKDDDDDDLPGIGGADYRQQKSAAELPGVDQVRREPDYDDLPSFGDAPPVAQPSGSYRRQRSAFYDPTTGEMTGEAVPTLKPQADANDQPRYSRRESQSREPAAGYQRGASEAGYRRANSQVFDERVPDPNATGYRRTNSQVFHDEGELVRDQRSSGYTRQSSGVFDDDVAPATPRPPAEKRVIHTTNRVRRGLGDVKPREQQDAAPPQHTNRTRRGVGGAAGASPGQVTNAGNMSVACKKCGRPVTVPCTGKVVTVPCLACGEINAIKT